MRASDFDLELDDLYRRSVGQLMAAEVLDLVAYDALFTYLCEKAVLIKQEHIVSQQVLSVLIDAQRAIESRAEYLVEARQNKKLAMKFAMLIDLIAHGKDCGDYQSGVPRIL